MNVQILHGVEGAKQAVGLAVIIDVFRAFSLECYLFARGAERILAVGAEETARALKAEHPDYVLIGERGGVILPGFDYGNSPSQTEGADLKGKTVIHTTSAGTQGIANAVKADAVITGSLVNAGAIARYIQTKGYETVSLVCMGLAGREEAPEDTLCGRYIKGILEGQEPDMQAELQKLRRDPTVERFFMAECQSVFPEMDYWMCTDVDCFDYVLEVTKTAEDVFCCKRVL